MFSHVGDVDNEPRTPKSLHSGNMSSATPNTKKNSKSADKKACESFETDNTLPCQNTQLLLKLQEQIKNK